MVAPMNALALATVCPRSNAQSTMKPLRTKTTPNSVGQNRTGACSWPQAEQDSSCSCWSKRRLRREVTCIKPISFRFFGFGFGEREIKECPQFPGPAIGAFGDENFVLRVGEHAAKSFSQILFDEELRVRAEPGQQFIEPLGLDAGVVDETDSVGLGEVDPGRSIGARAAEDLDLVTAGFIEHLVARQLGFEHVIKGIFKLARRTAFDCTFVHNRSEER